MGHGLRCEADGCDREPTGRNLCHNHYMRWYVTRPSGPECSVDDCSTPQYAKELCSKHYARARRNGSPTEGGGPRGLSDGGYIEHHSLLTDSGCVIWQGTISNAGYGQAGRGNAKYSAHRFVYETLVGPISDGQVVRHKCDVRACVNTEHLELGSRADNNRDKALRDRTGNAKMSNDDVIDARWAHGMGATGAALARAYGVTASTISAIVNRRTRIWV